LREQIAAINRRILAHNLKTPSVLFHMLPIDAEAEIRRLTSVQPPGCSDPARAC
jgi:hypothetical protein